MEINYNGKVIHEILNLTKVEEVNIMLDKDDNRHNKLILSYFMSVDDRGAIAVAALALGMGRLPKELTIVAVIESIFNNEDKIVDTLVGLFGLGDYFTSETALAELKLLIDKDDELESLRGIRLDGQNNDGDLVDNS